MRNTAPKDAAELEALETREWLESLDYVLQSGGPARVGRLLRELGDHARRSGVKLPFTANTPYINTISAAGAAAVPGQPRDRAPHQEPGPLERDGDGRQGQQGSKTASAATSRPIASAATLYEVGFNHFFKGKGDDHDGDIIYFQGHAAPGIYARAFLEGRLSAREARELPPRAEAGRRAVVVSAPVADARLLGVPHGVDGPRPDHAPSTRRASCATSRIAG